MAAVRSRQLQARAGRFSWLVLFAPIVALGLHIGVLDHPIIGEGREWTALNPQISDLGDWTQIWLDSTPPLKKREAVYRPLLAGFLHMQWRAWGHSPSSFHSFNLIMLVGAIILALLIYGRLASDGTVLLAGGFAFTLHPILTQSLYSVAGQGVLLSLLASLGAVYLFLWHRIGAIGPWVLVLSLSALTALAVGAHEMGLVLPLWLVALALLTPARSQPPSKDTKGQRAARRRAQPEDGRRFLRDYLLLAGTMGLVLTGFFVLRHEALGRMLPHPDVVDEMLAPLALPGWMIAPSVILAYLGRLFWPFHPTLIYDPADHAALLPPAWLGWVGLLLLIGLIVLCLRRWRAMALALLLLVIPLVGLSHFIPLSTFMTEGPLVFALPGCCLAFGLGVGRASEWVRRRSPTVYWPEHAVLAVVAVLVIMMGWQSHARGRQWKDAERLWMAEADLHPDNALPLIHLLRDLMAEGKLDAALAMLDEAKERASSDDLDKIVETEALLYNDKNETLKLHQLIRDELRADRPPVRGHMSKLALIAQRGAKDKVEQLWRAELAAYPDSFEAPYHLAMILLDGQVARPANRRDFKEAIGFAQKALIAQENRPETSDRERARALSVYGKLLAEADHQREAILHLREARKLDPTLYDPYIYLARLYWGRKDYTLAEDAIQRCRLYADVSSYRDIAELYTRMREDQGLTGEGLDWLMAFCKDFSADVPLLLYGARYQIFHGRYDQAREILMQLGRLGLRGPHQADWLGIMGALAWNRDGDRATAMDYFRQALRIDSTNADARTNLIALQSQERSSKEDQSPEPEPESQAPAQPSPSPEPTPAPPIPTATTSPTPTAVPSVVETPTAQTPVTDSADAVFEDVSTSGSR